MSERGARLVVWWRKSVCRVEPPLSRIRFLMAQGLAPLDDDVTQGSCRRPLPGLCGGLREGRGVPREGGINHNK
ncbi:hypothetical protein GCM10015536_77960 [Streptomyces griseomycini]|nr:hypothetical protein GCM10015536_77960 [Streptomyces griseomycini]